MCPYAALYGPLDRHSDWGGSICISEGSRCSTTSSNLEGKAKVEKDRPPVWPQKGLYHCRLLPEAPESFMCLEPLHQRLQAILKEVHSRRLSYGSIDTTILSRCHRRDVIVRGWCGRDLLRSDQLVPENWTQCGEGWRSRPLEFENNKDHSEWESALPLPDLGNVICLLTASFYHLENKDINNNNACLLRIVLRTKWNDIGSDELGSSHLC